MENFNYQGRSKKQYEQNAKVMILGVIGLSFVIVGMIIFGIVTNPLIDNRGQILIISFYNL